MRNAKWNEVSVDGLRSPNGGGGGRPRPFVIVAIWAEIPLQGLKSAQAFVFCTRAGVSELLAHDEWGGSSFPSEKAFFVSRERGGMTAAGTVAVQPCVTRTTVVCGANVSRDWGHTPVWAGHGRGVGCPWPSEESSELALMSEGPWLGLAFPCEGWAWSEQKSLMSSPRMCGLQHL